MPTRPATAPPTMARKPTVATAIIVQANGVAWNAVTSGPSMTTWVLPNARIPANRPTIRPAKIATIPPTKSLVIVGLDISVLLFIPSRAGRQLVPAQRIASWRSSCSGSGSGQCRTDRARCDRRHFSLAAAVTDGEQRSIRGPHGDFRLFKILIAVVLLAHGIGHVLGPLQVSKVAGATHRGTATRGC